MTSFQIVLVLTGLAAVGLIPLAHAYYRIRRRRHLASDYFERFQTVLAARQQGDLDTEAYTWLTYHADRMEQYLIDQGIVTFVPVGADYPGIRVEDEAHIEQGRTLLTETLPLLRTDRADDGAFERVEDLLVRYLGASEEEQRRAGWRLLNPLLWLREGIRSLLLLPLYLLGWFDLLRPAAVRRIANAFLVKLITALVVLVVLIGAVTALVLGWDRLVTVVRAFLSGAG